MAIFGRSYPIRSAVIIKGTVVTIVDVVAPSLVIDDETFYTTTVSAFNSLLPDLVSDADVVYQPTVSGNYTLAPDLVTDVDVFYVPIVEALGLSPSFVVDVDVFYSPTVASSDTVIFPSFVIDADTFYQPTVTARYTLLPSLVTDADVVYQPIVTAANTLSPSLVVDDDVFYTPFINVYQSLRPQEFIIDQDIIYSPSVVQVILPSLVTDSDVIFAPSSGKVLYPSFYEDTDSIYVTTVRLNSTILPPFFIDTDVFFVPTVQRQQQQGGGGGGSGGNVPDNYKYASKLIMASSGLIITLGAEANVTKTVNTRMMIYADSGGNPGALLGQSAVKTSVIVGPNNYPLLVPVSVLAGQSVWIAFHTDGNVNWFISNSPQGSRFNVDLFSDGPSNPFGPTSNDNHKAPIFVIFLSAVNATIAPQLVPADDQFFAPVVTTAGNLADNIYSDVETFYPPAVTTSYDVFVSTTLIDQDIFYSPTVATSITLYPGLVIDSDIIYDPAVGNIDPPDQQIFTPVFIDQDEIYTPTITVSGGVIDAQFFNADDVFYVPVVLSEYTLLPPEADDVSDDAFFSPEVTTSYTLYPGLVIDNDVINPTDITTTAQNRTLLPSFVIDDDLIYSCTVAKRVMRKIINLDGTASTEREVSGSFETSISVDGTANTERSVSGSSETGINLDGTAATARDLEGEWE